MPSLITKLLRGSFLRISNIVITVIISFFMMPFVISSLGERWYGLWILAASIVGYYGFLDFGLSGAVQKYISRAFGKDDYEEVNIIFNTVFFLFIIASLLVIIISTIVVFLCPKFVSNPQNIDTFKIVIFLIGLDVAFSFSARAFIGFLASNIRHDVIELIDILKMLFRTALIVIFLMRGFGIISLAVITLVVDCVQYITITLFVLIRFSSLKLRIYYIRKEWIKELLGFSTFSFITMIANRLRFYTDSFVISGFLGLGFVTHYNIGARVAIYYEKIVRTGMSITFPLFSKFEGQRDFESIRDKYIIMLKLTSIFAVLGGGFLLIFGKAFIIRWMGLKFVDSYSILVILVIGMLFNSIQSVSSTVLFAVSKHKQFSMIVAAEAVANLILSLILVQSYGIQGVAWGTTLPILVTSIIITPIYTCSVINASFNRLFKVMYGSLALVSILYFISWMIVRNIIENSYVSIMKLGIPVGIIITLLSTFVLLSKKERGYFKIPI